VAVRRSDLTGYARIRNAALDLFARDGFAATSIRDVAQAAGVSAGLVQHYFVNKAALQDAVNDYVGSTVISTFSDLRPTGSAIERAEQAGLRITALFREHPTTLLYVARAVVDNDETALALFDSFVAVALEQWQQAADDGLLHDDVDVLWAALQIVSYNLGTILFEAALSRHLPESFFSTDGLERWRDASTALFRRGIYKQAEEPLKKKRRAR
jgi:AcrR family transcriptional regulator